jgi:phosphatidylinositol glycan class P protein
MSGPPSRTPSPMPMSPTSPLAAFPPLPEPSARSRAPEIYGFVAWTGTALGYVLFLIWALAPPGALDAVGWTWYPSRCVPSCAAWCGKLKRRYDREWAVRVPAWSCILALCTYAGYYALALLNTPSFDAPSTIIGALPCVFVYLDNE